MADHPVTLRLKRGGVYRTAIMSQPHFPRCLDVSRCERMLIEPHVNQQPHH